MKVNRFISTMSFLVFIIVSGSGCASTKVNISPVPPKNYTKLGTATGKATGSLGILGTAYYFVPMGLNSRVERAYDAAVNSVPGATGLMDVSMQESWFWWLFGTGRTVTIEGDAIR